MHGELHLSPKPPWFVTNKQAHTVADAFRASRLGPVGGIYPNFSGRAERLVQF